MQCSATPCSILCYTKLCCRVLSSTLLHDTRLCSLQLSPSIKKYHGQVLGQPQGSPISQELKGSGQPAAIATVPCARGRPAAVPDVWCGEARTSNVQTNTWQLRFCMYMYVCMCGYVCLCTYVYVHTYNMLSEQLCNRDCVACVCVRIDAMLAMPCIYVLQVPSHK